MLKKILPNSISAIIESRLNYQKLYEIRFRSNAPITVNYGGSYYHLTETGISLEGNSSVLFCDSKLVENIIYKAGEYSIYAVNNQLRQGFLTIAGGIRLGISGEIVEEGGEVKTIKNFSSINIRIPHEVSGCGLTAFKYINFGKLHSTLLISPPGCGKTTFLRDLAKTFSQNAPIQNIMILDERSEIAACHNGQAQLDVGKYSDVLTNCSKEFGFLQAVRVMRPDIIITDELATASDIEAARQAVASGITVIASAHAQDVYDLSEKSGFEGLFKHNLFTRFVVISARRGPGTYEGIYDENLKSLYFSGS